MIKVQCGKKNNLLLNNKYSQYSRIDDTLFFFSNVFTAKKDLPYFRPIISKWSLTEKK